MNRTRADSTAFDTGAWGGAEPEAEEVDIDPQAVIKKEQLVREIGELQEGLRGTRARKGPMLESGADEYSGQSSSR
ncbi:hypothetical protein P7C70_g232, partial [Phenoliferia sp. Uapishka_3]